MVCGEPLLQFDSVLNMSNEFKRISKFYKRVYSSAITTNGYLLDLNTFNKLLKCGVNIFQITIDGIEKIHNKLRPYANGQKTYDIVLKNLKDIKKLKNRNFHIIIRSNFTKEVFCSLNDYLNIISELCENDDRFSLMMCYAAEWSNNIEEEFKRDFIKNLSSLKPIYNRILKLKMKINFMFPLEPENGGCNLGRNNRYFIRLNGEIHKCTIGFERYNSIVGYLDNDDIILNENFYSKLLNSNNCKKIYKCFYSPICKGEVCSLNRKEKKCPEGKNNLAYYLKLKDNYKEFEILD